MSISRKFSGFEAEIAKSDKIMIRINERENTP